LEGLYNFLQANAIYIVMIIVLIVWIGIFFYMLTLDKRLKSIEKELNNNKPAK
jgi:CcmD family protein